MKASKKQFRKAHALIGDFARAFPGVTPAEFKAALLVLFPAFLAEADGEELPEPTTPESTSAMQADRMGELIEFLLWLGSSIGVAFPHDD